MREVKVTELINALKHVVMFNSSDEVCKMLNGFAVIDDTFDFDTDIIEARIEKQFYFSRDSTRMLYPMLAFSFNNKSLGHYSNDQYNDYCLSFALGVVDQMKDPCTNCTDCEKRGVQQIYLDSADLLKKVISTIPNLKYYKTLKGVTEKYVVEHPDVMALLLSEGIYDSAVIQNAESSTIQNMFATKNENLSFIEMPLSKQRTVANYVTLTFCEPCTENEMTFTYKKYSGQSCC